MKIIIEVSTCRMSMNPEEGLRLFRASSLRRLAGCCTDGGGATRSGDNLYKL